MQCINTATVMQERVGGGATPSNSSDTAHRVEPERAPVQSPVGGATGEKAKTVFNSIISPVLTLFQGKQEASSQGPRVVLQVRSHAGVPSVWTSSLQVPLLRL